MSASSRSVDPEAPVCSARGCQKPAAWTLRWNNPKLHTAERRKEWLACVEHRDSLGAFLQVRGFLRETVPFTDEGTGEADRADGGVG